MQLESHKVVCGQSMLSNSLRVYLNNKNRLQPIIGLSSVTECVQLSGESDAVYLCEVCVCRLSKADVRSHIMGSLHRYKYIKVHYPHFVSEWKLSPELSKLARPLMEMAQILEKREGSGDIQVMKMETGIYEEITSRSEKDALILLRAVRAEQQLRGLQSQSEKPLAQSEYLSIQSHRCVKSSERLSVQPEKPALQVDKQTIVWENPTALTQNPPGISASSVLYQGLSVQSGLSSEDELVPHRTGTSVKCPVSTLPRPHDNCRPLTRDDTAGGQTLLGGGEGEVLEEIPAKPNGCEPVFKVSLSLTDGPLLVERNSFSLEPYPGSPTHTPIHSPIIGASPEPPVTALHSFCQMGNKVVTRPRYTHTAIDRLGPVIPDQQSAREDCMYEEEEPRFTDNSLYLRRDQERTDHLIAEVFRFNDSTFHEEQDYKPCGNDPRDGDMNIDTESVAGPGLLTTAHLSGCRIAENLSDIPLIVNNKQGNKMGNVCHFDAGKRLAEDDGAPDVPFYTGERLAEGGFSTGTMYQSGERLSDSQYLTEEITSDSGIASGVCVWTEEQEPEQCLDEIQKGRGLVVEFTVKKKRRGGKKRKMGNFYNQDYFKRQPPQQHLAQGLTITGNCTVGRHMVDTSGHTHSMAAHRFQTGPDVSMHMGDTAAPSWAQWSEAECGRVWTSEGSNMNPDTYRREPQGYARQPSPDSYTPFPEGHRMNRNPYQAVYNDFRTIPGPYNSYSNPDTLEPQPLPYPHHNLAHGNWPHPQSDTYFGRIGDVQHLVYNGPPTPHYPQPSDMDGWGTPLPCSFPIPSHYNFREDYRGHRPAKVKVTRPEPPWF